MESRCGIVCSECEYREKVGCKGCINIDKPFWGEKCIIKSCCEENGQSNCGECNNFPCDNLKDFAYDEAQGDNGKRLVQCRIWTVLDNSNYKDLDKFLSGFKGVTKDYKEEWEWIRYQVGDKMFAALCGYEGRHIITLKLEVLDGDFLRKQYEDVMPGHYMNKQHWNSIYLDGSVPEDVMKDCIEKSYNLVFGGLTKKKQKEILGE